MTDSLDARLAWRDTPSQADRIGGTLLPLSEPAPYLCPSQADLLQVIERMEGAGASEHLLLTQTRRAPSTVRVSLKALQKMGLIAPSKEQGCTYYISRHHVTRNANLRAYLSS